MEGENRKIGKSKQKSANLQKEFQAASRGLTAVEWLQKSVDLGINGKFTDPGKAIEYLNEAIRLKPDSAEAYTNRGLVYILYGNSRDGCRSLIRACELGKCKTSNRNH